MRTLSNPRPESVHWSGPLARRALAAAAGFWLVAALIGQWAFSAYIAAFYGPAMASGDYQAWSALSALGARAYVPGDDVGNRFFGFHALAAGVVAFGGALQLIPQVRNRWPRFHRWNGRVFLVTVLGLALSGFWLVWVRGSAPSQLNGVSTTINGVLILAFAGLAYANARARRFQAHQRWALRLYLVSNAQWFLRVGMFAYLVATMAAGRQPSMSGLFPTLWTFGCFLVPLAMAELYLRARDHGGAVSRLAVATALVALTLAMAAGAFAYGMFTARLAAGAPLALG